MVWDHANYLVNKNWFNIQGGLLGSAFTKTIINYSFIEYTSRLQWLGSYLSFDNATPSTAFFSDSPNRFSYITSNFVQSFGPGRDYLFKSVNRGTNIAVPGKIHFFNIGTSHFCNFNYYFKRFRKKSLKSKHEPALSKKLRLLRHTAGVYRRGKHTTLRVKSDYKKFISYLTSSGFQNAASKKIPAIMQYLWSSPFTNKLSYLLAKEEFKVDKSFLFFTERSLVDNWPTHQAAHRSKILETHDVYSGISVTDTAANTEVSSSWYVTPPGVRPTHGRVLQKKYTYLASPRLQLFFKKPNQLGRGVSTAFWSTTPTTYYRTPTKAATSRFNPSGFSRPRQVHPPLWYKRMRAKKKTAETLARFETTNKVYWSHDLLNFYYYAFPAYRFVRASILRKKLLQQRLKTPKLSNFL
jgi:hypothetical protein